MTLVGIAGGSRLAQGALVSAIGLLTGLSAARAETVTVFAAASLTDAFTAVGEAYEAAGDDTIRFSFASSSVLARQIEAGAPAQILVSANESWMDYLVERDLIVPDTRTSPIGNTLVLIAPADAGTDAVTIDADFDLAALLAADDRIAMGDPDHVPAGIYGRQALASLGLWDGLEHRLARTDDVRAALALVETGEVPFGIVYATDAAVSAGVVEVGRFPADSHPPITYPFAIVEDGDTEAVRAFFDHLLGDEAGAILSEAGFSLRRSGTHDQSGTPDQSGTGDPGS